VPSLLFAAMLFASSTAFAQGDLQDLLKKMPRTANSIMAINVDGLHNSPIGITRKWKDLHEESYVNRPFILPPEAKWAIVGAMFDPVSNESIWELGIMSLTSDLSMRSIARAEGGYVDNIDGTEAAWVPSNAYFVQVAAKTLGVMYPGHRQLVARWVDFAKNNKESELSPYLRSAAEVLDDKSIQVVLAIDLKDMARPHTLKEKLANSPTLKGKNIDLDALGQVISTIQGATFTISLTDKAIGRLQVDFLGDTEILNPVAKQLILEVLDDHGASIEVMKNWTLETSRGTIALVGELDQSGMRRIGSVLELPSTKFTTNKDDQPSQGPTVKASKAYYGSVQALVDDLRKTPRDNRDNHAVWMERYARKIDRLPILNVDDELLAFGAQTAERFRECSVAKRSALVRSGVRKSQVYAAYDSTYYTNTGGYVNRSTTEQDRASIDKAENAQATKVRVDLWKQIEDDMAQIRNSMTRKYMTEF
jgi:hypothetical protein